jgi:hypothetical protein
LNELSETTVTAAPLRQLEGTPTSGGPLHVVAVRRGRFREELDALVAVGADAPTIHVKHFAGRPSEYVPPWIEASFPRDDEPMVAEIVTALADLLPAGGRLMAVYGQDETDRGLQQGVPPAATPLGRALLRAGCTWFKDWYFAEGGCEGETKLQGNKPLTAELRSGQLAAVRVELAAWLDSLPQDPAELARRARERALTVLASC